METIKEEIVWHICKQDGLPPIDKKVLVCCLNEKGNPFVRVGRRDKYRWNIAGTIEGVYAWAELPSPPPTSYEAVFCARCRHKQYNRDNYEYFCDVTSENIKRYHEAFICEHFVDVREQYRRMQNETTSNHV